MNSGLANQVDDDAFILAAVEGWFRRWQAVAIQIQETNRTRTKRDPNWREPPTHSDFANLVSFVLRAKYPHRTWDRVGLTIKARHSKTSVDTFPLCKRFCAESPSAETVLEWILESIPRFRGRRDNAPKQAEGLPPEGQSLLVNELIALFEINDLVLIWEDGCLPPSHCHPDDRDLARRIAVRIEYLMTCEGFTRSQLLDAIAQPTASNLSTKSRSTIDEIVALLGAMRNTET